MLRVLAIATLLLMAPVTDNFDDGVIDAGLWSTGVAISTQSFNVRPDLLTVDESTGQLVFTLQGNQTYGATNAYLTNSAYDLRGKRISAKLSRAGGLDVWIAAGTDHFNHVEAMLIQGSEGPLVLSRVFVNSAAEVNYFYTQTADVQDYIGLRFSANGNKIYCETSADGVNWNTRGVINQHQPFISASRVELGGGGFRPDAGTFTSTANDFKLEP